MKLLVLSILVGVWMLYPMAAQKQGQERIDSLLAELPKCKEDSNKVNVLNDLSYYYFATKPNEGIAYGKKGLELAEKLEWKKGKANAYSSIGYNYYSKSEYSKALEHYFQALKLFEELHDLAGEAKVSGKIGLVYVFENEYPKAKEYLLKAIRMNEEIHDKAALAENLRFMGNIYLRQHIEKTALEYYFKALRIEEESGNKNGIARNLVNIGIALGDQKDRYRELDYKFKALEMYRELGDKDGMGSAYGNLGWAYFLLATDTTPVIDTRYVKFRISTISEALQQSKIYMDSANIVSKEIGTHEYDTYLIISKIDSINGKYKDAYENFKIYTVKKDSVFSSDKSKMITQLQLQYDQEKEDAVILIEQKRQQQQKYVLALGLVMAIIFGFWDFRQKKRIKLAKNFIEKEKHKSDTLLLNILPSEVADELKSTGTAQAKHFDNVTVLFTDFKNFTTVSEQLSPQELVDELHACFKGFDEICSKHNIEKIKTIGDAYLAICGLPQADEHHAEHVVNAALEIREFMEKRREILGEKTFEIRIGINSGSVVAGIVGVKKFAYDIWGDTVNTAARMEQNSEPGKINISETTHALVKDKFACEFRGEIDAKNKGKLKMYFVEKFRHGS
jgi:adenylate cyclase